MKKNAKGLIIGMFILFATSSVAFAQPAGGNVDADKKAEQLMKAKKFGEAIPYLNQMIKLEPKNVKWQFDKGLCEERTKKYEDAKASFNKVLSINPKSADAYMHIAMVEVKEKKYDDAAVNFNKAIEAENIPGKKMQYKMMIVDAMVQKGDLGKAKTTLAELQKAAPTNMKVLYYAGEIKMKEKNWVGAKEEYTKIINNPAYAKMKPAQKAQYCYSLGLCTLESGDELTAKSYWKKANTISKYSNLIGNRKPEWLVEFSEAKLGGEDPWAADKKPETGIAVSNKPVVLDEFGNPIQEGTAPTTPETPAENNNSGSGSTDDMDWGF